MENNELNNNTNIQPNIGSQIMMGDTPTPQNNVNQGINTVMQNNLNQQQNVPVQDVTPPVENNIFSNPEPTVSEPVQPVVEEPKIEPPKEKKSKGSSIIIILLILVILGLGGYIVYDKFIEKDDKTKSNDITEVDNGNKNNNTIEYVSFDGKEYLKLNEDGTYQLNISRISGNDITKKGSYKKENDNSYSLDNGSKVEIKDNYIEITKLETENFKFVNAVLFDKNKLTDIKTKINNNITTYIENLKNNYPNLAEIEKVETNIKGSCFRYAIQETDKDKEQINCSITYKIYLKDYNATECKDDLSQENENNSKYFGYMIPSGECKENYILSGKFFKLNQNDNYKITSVFTGL